MFPLPVAILPITSAHIEPQEHYHNLTGGSTIPGFGQSLEPIQRKSRHFQEWRLSHWPRAEAKMLWIILLSPQGDIVQVDHACPSGLVGSKRKEQILHVCERGQ
jgi:hypothetical protein